MTYSRDLVRSLRSLIDRRLGAWLIHTVFHVIYYLTPWHATIASSVPDHSTHICGMNTTNFVCRMLSKCNTDGLNHVWRLKILFRLSTWRISTLYWGHSNTSTSRHFRWLFDMLGAAVATTFHELLRRHTLKTFDKQKVVSTCQTYAWVRLQRITMRDVRM
jgi:hypothetical protein